MCPLAKPNATVESLTTQIFDLIDEVKYEPILMGSNITTDVVGVTELLGGINSALRVQIAYAPILAGYLNAVLERNFTAYHIYQPLLLGETSLIPPSSDAVSNIRCTDSAYRAENLDDVLPRVEKLLESGRLSGDVYTSSYLQCARWRLNAKGRYEGDFRAKTKNPMLIIGSPYDLRTPVVSAFNVSEGFEGSVVLQHNGLGVSNCQSSNPAYSSLLTMIIALRVVLSRSVRN